MQNRKGDEDDEDDDNDDDDEKADDVKDRQVEEEEEEEEAVDPLLLEPTGGMMDQASALKDRMAGIRTCIILCRLMQGPI